MGRPTYLRLLGVPHSLGEQGVGVDIPGRRERKSGAVPDEPALCLRGVLSGGEPVRQVIIPWLFEPSLPQLPEATLRQRR